MKTFRILDASANRAREALRVVEDFVRFELEDAFLTEQLKGLRHGLIQTLSQIPLSQRLSFRETQTDVGTGISTSQEFHRENLSHVVAANFSRLQESLRSLEEFSKVAFPQVAVKMEQLRYRSYTLQRGIYYTLEGQTGRLATARWYGLVDTVGGETVFVEKIRRWRAGGVTVFQLRDKKINDRQLVRFGKILRSVLEENPESRPLFIMNDRPDLALVCRADGVHVGQEELPVRDVRQILGDGKLVGVSTHSLEQARQAVLDGADYIGVGPVFPSPTKTFEVFPGLELVREVGVEITLPAFAIGGIGRSNVEKVWQAGIPRVAAATGMDELLKNTRLV